MQINVPLSQHTESCGRRSRGGQQCGPENKQTNAGLYVGFTNYTGILYHYNKKLQIYIRRDEASVIKIDV